MEFAYGVLDSRKSLIIGGKNLANQVLPLSFYMLQEG